MALRPRSGKVRLLLAGTAIAAGFSGCTLVGPPAAPPGPSTGWTEQGIASWYGERFHGRQTASGEIYDMDAMTAAHPTLPFGTVLQVVNLDNGRTVRVRVNDRGPYAGGRVLDLSRRAARELEMVGPGTARVHMTVVEPASR
jgi:rare lipoprotein A